METLNFHFENGLRHIPAQPELVGVVSSGNLEVLVESAALQGGCAIEIKTAANGFAAIWEAVVTDFNQRWQLSDARISINDMGATPAVVRLRLDQAIETLLERAS
jgi:malonate decarboxylase delta subunit